MRKPVDAVTARALRCGVDLREDPRAAARELATIAHGQHAVLVHALHRVERVIAEEPSNVARRARDAIELAIEEVDTAARERAHVLV